MTDAPVILSLETATLGGSVFLGRGTVELAGRSGDPQVSHSNSLLSDINDCLSKAGVSLQEVDLFACASGPGSFTGLRIGIATLKALAATLKRPCVGIPTLHAVAYSTTPRGLEGEARAAGPSRATVALLPAGRGEVFAQMFSVSGERVVEIDSAAHLSPQKLFDKYGTMTELTWAGSGAHSQRELLADYAQRQGIAFAEIQSGDQATSERRGWLLASPNSHLAAHVAALALQKFERGEVQLPQTLSAIYVRPSDAELKEQCP